MNKRKNEHITALLKFIYRFVMKTTFFKYISRNCPSVPLVRSLSSQSTLLHRQTYCQWNESVLHRKEQLASINGLQRLVDICAAYGDIHDIKFNHAKTVCMYLPSKGNCTLNSPLISLNLQKLSFVPKFKYLGSFITQDNSDDENMRRLRGNCYARSNGIIKNFYACSPVVKCDLFKAFCCNMYCFHLWCDLKNETLRRLIVGYNHSFRIIMKYPRHCSASGMFVFNNVPSFKELWRKSIYGIKQRVDNSLNKVVNTVANTTLLSSRLRKHWRTVLYRLPAA